MEDDPVPYVVSGVFGVVFLVGLFLPLLGRRMEEPGQVGGFIMMSAVNMWIFYVTVYDAQMNPLSGPELSREQIQWMADKWITIRDTTTPEPTEEKLLVKLSYTVGKVKTEYMLAKSAPKPGVPDLSSDYEDVTDSGSVTGTQWMPSHALMFDHKVLVDGLTLFHYNVYNGAILLIMLASDLPKTFLVRIPSGPNPLILTQNMDTRRRDITDLKAQIYAKTNIENIELYHDYKELYDDDWKSFSLLPNGSTLWATHGWGELQGSFYLTLHDRRSGRSSVHSFLPTHLMEYVRYTISAIDRSVPRDRLRMYYNGDLLQDDQTLSHYDIKQDNVIDFYY